MFDGRSAEIRELSFAGGDRPARYALSRKPDDEIVELPRDDIPRVRGILRDGHGGTRQPLSTYRIAIERLKCPRDALRRHFSHLKYRELGYVAPRRRDQLGAPAPHLGTRRVVGNDLGRAGGAVLAADQPPALPHRRVDPHVAGV